MTDKLARKILRVGKEARGFVVARRGCVNPEERVIVRLRTAYRSSIM
jgi:hypothetical protein